jgi:hypothetical protein
MAMDQRIELWQRLRQAKDWAGAIDQLEQESEKLTGERERSKQLFQLARVTEEVVPERDRALAIYQRAWKLDRRTCRRWRSSPRLPRAGRLEMVAKLGELELRAGNGTRSTWPTWPRKSAKRCSTAGNGAGASVPLPGPGDQPRLAAHRDAIAAADYDRTTGPVWSELTAGPGGRLEHRRPAALRAPTSSRDPGRRILRGSAAQVLTNDPQNESANFLFEQLLAAPALGHLEATTSGGSTPPRTTASGPAVPPLRAGVGAAVQDRGAAPACSPRR